MQKKDLKIIFMGTPMFAQKSLEALVDNGYKISLVVTGLDKKSGRGMKVSYSPVKEYAIKKDIEVYQPIKIRGNDEALNKIKEIKPDLIIVVAYGKILPQDLLDIPKYGAINVHGSLLPKHRGAGPIQKSIMDGDIVTGITTIYMDAGMDTGDIIYKKEIKIDIKDTYTTLYNKLMVLGADTLIYTMDKFLELEANLPRKKQGDNFTIAPMIGDEITKINFNTKGKVIINKVRALNIIPGAFAKIDDERQYKIYEAKSFKEEEIKTFLNITLNKKFEEYLNGEIVYLNANHLIMLVKCKDGYVNILELKPKNKGIMKSSEYIRGNKIKEGDIFII